MDAHVCEQKKKHLINSASNENASSLFSHPHVLRYFGAIEMQFILWHDNYNARLRSHLISRLNNQSVAQKSIGRLKNQSRQWKWNRFQMATRNQFVSHSLGFIGKKIVFAKWIDENGVLFLLRKWFRTIKETIRILNYDKTLQNTGHAQPKRNPLSIVHLTKQCRVVITTIRLNETDYYLLRGFFV